MHRPALTALVDLTLAFAIGAIVGTAFLNSLPY